MRTKIFVLGLLTYSGLAYGETRMEAPANWALGLVNTTSAWQITQSSSDIVVAVIDTGADTKHPSLRNNLWVNPGESGTDGRGHDRATNGVDDDGNGFIDDVHGWNFADGNNELTDRHGHGTHVAGIIQSTAPKTSLMILKFFNPEATGAANLAHTIEAIRYAIKMKARIINYSGGGTDKNPEEEKVMQQVSAQNILFVAAAGNEKSNSDLNRFYPADYGYPNIASVTAIDENQRVLSSSNYGIKTVDLAAPGKNIRSSLPGGKFGTMTGTSQATAFVTGAAALYMAQNPAVRDPEAIISVLVRTGARGEQLVGKTRGETRLDAYRSLIMKDRNQDAFGDVSANDTGDFAAKLDPSAVDLGAEEMPVRKVVSAVSGMK
jgi:thermitase